MTNIKLMILAGLILLCACETVPKNQTIEYVVVARDLEWVKDVSIADRTVCVTAEADSDTKNDLNPSLEKAKQKLELTLKESGYVIVDKRAQGDLWISISAYSIKPLVPKDASIKNDNESKPVQNSVNGPRKVVPDSEGRTFVVSFASYSQHYGKRALTISTASLEAGDQRSLAIALDHEIERWQKEVGKTPVDTAVVKTKSDKKLPGCTPRFGFDIAVKRDGLEKVYVVNEVIKSSPASLAGFKIGDQILAIDSVKYFDFAKGEVGDKVYEANVEVPVKLLRQGKEFRTSIKSQISCD